MAQIVFIINDEDGAVNVTAAAEPFISLDENAELTPAQSVAQLIAVTLAAALNPDAGEENSDDPTSPELVLVEGNSSDADGA